MFSSCDDGDIVLENLNFGNATISTCSPATVASGLLFKANESEILLINIPPTTFDSVTSTVENPKVLTISNDQILYRKYSGKVSNSVICDAIPPASPSVIDQWTGQPGGTIEIITTDIVSTNQTTGVRSITGYSNVIYFKNLQLKNDQNGFVYESYYFGEYIVTREEAIIL